MKHLKLLAAFLALHCTVSAAPFEVTVALDGSGDYRSLQEAIFAVPDSADFRSVIHIKEGVYDTEKLIVPASKRNISFIGESRKQTIISYHMYNGRSPETRGQLPVEDWRKWKHEPMLVRTSATIIILGDGCSFENLTIRNTAGPVGQALAVTVCADRTQFRRCDLLGYQDTIYLWHSQKRSYFENCLIVGRTDYIYGGGIGFFDRCRIESYGGGWITAPSTPKEQPYGFVFDRCRFTYRDNSPREGDDGRPYYIGRPWHNYPKVAILHSYLSKELHPLGWAEWHMEYAPHSADLHLYEYGNRGKGADMSGRNGWAGLRALTAEEVENYTIERVFGEHPDMWY